MLKQDETKKIVVGSITGHFGVKGWVKIRSFTRPAEQIFTFETWFIRGANDKESPGSRKRRFQPETAEMLQRFTLENGRFHGRNLIARLEQVAVREDAEKLIGKEILVDESALPPAGSGEYYWTDLIGLTVRNTSGETLGVVDHLVETGANDVMVLLPISIDSGSTEQQAGSEILVPWIDQVIVRVNLRTAEAGGEILVDWEADF